jgi:hypothetical protein
MIINTIYIYYRFTLFTAMLFEILNQFKSCKYDVNDINSQILRLLYSFRLKNQFTSTYFTSDTISINYAFLIYNIYSIYTVQFIYTL